MTLFQRRNVTHRCEPKGLSQRVMMVLLACVLPSLLLFFPNSGNLRCQSKGKHQSDISRKLEDLGLTTIVLDSLNAVGANVPKALQEQYARGEMIKAVLSDLVVIGQVQEIVDMPGPESQPFHSKVLVQVQSVLKGSRDSKKIIEVLRQSGPIDATTSVKYSTDVNLRPGEKVLLFLVRPEKSGYLAKKFRQQLQVSGKNFPESNFCANYNSDFLIIDDKVTMEGKSKELREVERNVRTVDRIIRQIK
jgi:hypothetical protein